MIVNSIDITRSFALVRDIHYDLPALALSLVLIRYVDDNKEEYLMVVGQCITFSIEVYELEEISDNLYDILRIRFDSEKKILSMDTTHFCLAAQGQNIVLNKVLTKKAPPPSAAGER